MIPVAQQSEPANFSAQVRGPGQQFLRRVPNPTTNDWKGKEYWRKALPDMREAYNSICAYCATWISYGTGSHSVDHFIPRALQPNLAYEWDNFRYVSSRFNSRKGTHTILDPFKIQEGWFILDFSCFFIKPDSHLSAENKKLVLDTIKILKLNDDEDLVTERQGWVCDLFNGEITFDHLKKKAPFIAYELERQNL